MSETAHAAPEGAALLLTLLLIFGAAKLMAELFERLRQPAVVGEILAGVLIGPAILGWVTPNAVTHALSELGVIFLLFGVGLETPPAAILRVGRPALLTAVLGVVLPFVAGWGYMQAMGESSVASLFMGAAMVATSVGITARVLSAMGLLDSPAARIILGAAVIDDVLGLLVLAVVAGMAAGHADYASIAGTGALALGFIAVTILILAPLMTRLAPALRRLHLRHAFFGIAVCLCLALAVAAAAIGVAAIIGAFLAGMALAESAHEDHDTHAQVRGVSELLTPFFLAGIGMQLQLSVFAEGPTLAMAVIVTLIAVATKLVGCGAAVLDQGLREAARVGVGMVPRGEVGIVVAQMGLAMGAIDARLFGVVLFMAVATTLIAPPLIKPLFAGARTG